MCVCVVGTGMDLRESMRRVGRLGENGFLMEIHKIEVKKKQELFV